MKTWEFMKYKVNRVYAQRDYEELNKLGLECWEPYCVIIQANLEIYFLKRVIAG